MKKIKKKYKIQLPFNNFCEANLVKQTEITKDFYTTCTMANTHWKSMLCEDRHIFTRYACHGYHSLFCINENFRTCKPNIHVSVNIVVKPVINIICLNVQ
jgi:hypothetical protein